VAFGLEILKIVPGRVSTETDARSFLRHQGSIDKAHQLIALYEKNGISRDRVLIKIASTWEGSRPPKRSPRKASTCNLTLLFSMARQSLAPRPGPTDLRRSSAASRLVQGLDEEETSASGRPRGQSP